MLHFPLTQPTGRNSAHLMILYSKRPSNDERKIVSALSFKEEQLLWKESLFVDKLDENAQLCHLDFGSLYVTIAVLLVFRAAAQLGRRRGRDVTLAPMRKRRHLYARK